MADDPVLDAKIRPWTIGDYPVIARYLLPISEDVVAGLDIQPGERVLDVAVGDGNAAILAAKRGGVVTGVDITPTQIDRARDRCAAEGVEVDLRVGDAEALDLPDASFDVVMSVMGMIFAPGHAAAVREFGRICRPGGRVALTAWAADGWMVAWRSKVADLGLPPPAGPRPDEWGHPDEAVRRLQAAGLEATVDTREFVWRFPSAERAFDTFASAAGPFVIFVDAMKQRGKADVARTALLEVMAATNVATDGTCVLPAPYLLITATR